MVQLFTKEKNTVRPDPMVENWKDGITDKSSQTLKSSQAMAASPVDEAREGIKRNYFHRIITMKLPILALSGYLGLGVFIGAYIEEWSLIDSVYFTVQTLTTVGYGDKTPSSATGRLLCTIFILYGAVLLTWLVGVVTRYISQRMDASIVRKRVPKQHLIGNILFSEAFQLLRSLILIASIVGIGMTYLIRYEDFTWINSLYFCVVTLSTVGYGDSNQFLDSNTTKLFLIFYLLFGTVAIAKVMGASIEGVLDAHQRKKRKEILKTRLSITELRKADQDHSGTLSEAEFTVFQLTQMGLVRISDIEAIKEQFYILDTDNSGQVTFEEAMRG